jgi:hypothetical protein
MLLLSGLMLGLQPGFASVGLTSAVVLTIAALCAIMLMRRVIRLQPANVAAIVRRSRRHPVYLRQRDPDAAGRPRPRAPGAGLYRP